MSATEPQVSSSIQAAGRGRVRILRPKKFFTAGPGPDQQAEPPVPPPGSLRSARGASPRSSDHLNMIRGVAAVAVLIGHLRGLFFRDFGSVSHSTWSTYLVYTATGLGHQAVLVFFVLSGFFVAGSALKDKDRWSWKNYLGNRLTRLYLVLIPALVFTALLDQVSMSMPLGERYFFHAIEHFNTVPLAFTISPMTFLGNICFLQTVVVPPFGSDEPLWSLANEFWYYMLFPLIMGAFCAVRPMARILDAGLAVAIAIWLPGAIIGYFPVWLMGAAIHFITPLRPGRHVPVWRALSLSVFAIFLALDRMSRFPAVLSDFCVGLSFAVCMYCLLADVRPAGDPSGTRKKYRRAAGILAGCSYSVYAIHMPLIMFGRTVITTAPWEPTFRYLCIGLVMSMSIGVVGYLFSRITEARTEVARGAVFGWLGLSPRLGLAARVGSG